MCADRARYVQHSAQTVARWLLPIEHRNANNILFADTRRNKPQCISNPYACVRHETNEFIIAKCSSTIHSITRFLANVTCAGTTSTARLRAFLLRHESSRNAVFYSPAHINSKHVQQYRWQEEHGTIQRNTSTNAPILARLTGVAKLKQKKQCLQCATIGGPRASRKPELFRTSTDTSWCTERSSTFERPKLSDDDRARTDGLYVTKRFRTRDEACIDE